MLPAIMSGASACISGLANVFPELNVELYDLIRKGDYSEAIRKQLMIIEARKIMHTAETYPACYALLKLRGVDVGYPKPLFEPLQEKHIEMLITKFKEMGLF